MVNKKTSIHEVAKRANVSIATVSRVINGNKGYGEKTKQKVLEAIDYCNYIPNSNAVSLRTMKSLCIGVIVPDITSEFFASIVRELENYFILRHYILLVCDSNEDPEKEDISLRKLIDRNVDAIIYISGQEVIGNIKKISNIPVIYIDRSPKNANILVLSDNVDGGYLAGKELINKNCKEIVLVRDIRNVSTVRQRKEGLLQALEEEGYDISDPKIEIFCRPEYENTKQTIEKVIKEQGCYFDGLFCTCDMMALGAVHALKGLGYRVPEDVKVVGFDNVSISRFCDPPITTISQNFKEIAIQAGEIALEMIEKGNIYNKVVKIPVSLEVREST